MACGAYDAFGFCHSEAIVTKYGTAEVLRRLSDPFWFQSLGMEMGMDWHSSGITTSVMGALKWGLNPRYKELGIYICGGKGKKSRDTPDELLRFGERTGLNGLELVHCSKLSAKMEMGVPWPEDTIGIHQILVLFWGSRILAFVA